MPVECKDSLNNPPSPVLDLAGTDGMTQQQFLEECDINNIMSRYQPSFDYMSGDALTGRQVAFSDVSGITDYADLLGKVANGEAAFMQLPGDVRARFGNSVKTLVDWLDNPTNIPEAVALGIVPEGYGA